MAPNRTPGHRYPVNDRWTTRAGEHTSRYGKGLRYQATYVNPNREPVSKSFPTKKAANAWLTAQTAAIATGGYVAPDKESVTLGQVATRWRGGLTGRPSTIATYSVLVDGHILPRWENTPVRSITRRDVETWLRGLTTKKGTPVSTATARQTFKLLRQIISVAMDPTDPIITVDPTRGVKVAPAPAVGGSGDRRFASPEQVELIARAADYRAAQPKSPGRRTDLVDSADEMSDPAADWQSVEAPVSADGLLIRLLSATGARFGEIAALRVGRLDLDGPRPTLFIAEAAVEVDGRMHVGPPKTAESVRRVPFRKSLVPLLRTHLVAQGITDDDQAFVFAQRDGGPLRLRNWSARVFRPAAKLAGVGITVHGLRHSAASAAIRQGMTPVQVSRILGHSKPSITLDVYSHEFPDDLVAIGDEG
ncbi:site-specific integrase [Gordonia McavH-238-E]|uniref:tyrosine-type recombinase/integrase n=1 Tax=Gordonia sp. McavH-238-E TaxID=2917736 RepID=UPI001EF43437|nr:site-specific integrase [Gordonia sp. McavH-238-E]MCG7631131.1 site-specific integrase [Gordonia sp. McavH-238-E]